MISQKNIASTMHDTEHGTVGSGRSASNTAPGQGNGKKKVLPPLTQPTAPAATEYTLSGLQEQKRKRQQIVEELNSAAKNLPGTSANMQVAKSGYEKAGKELKKWTEYTQALKANFEKNPTEENLGYYVQARNELSGRLARYQDAERGYQTAYQNYNDAYSRYSTSFTSYQEMPEDPGAQVWAEAAEREYDAYIRSPEYSERMAAQTRQKMLQTAMIPGASIAEAPLSSVTPVDSKEKELRALRDYYANAWRKEQDDAILAKDLEEFAKWPEEDQLKLQMQIDSGMGSFNAIAGAIGADTQARAYAGWQELIKKYGKDTVDQIMESVSRSRNQEITEDAQRVAKDVPESFMGGALAFTGARAANLMGNIASPVGLLTNITRPGTGRYSTLDPNNPGNLLNVIGSGLDDAVVHNIRGVPEDMNAGAWREVLATLYQAGASATDSYLRIVVSGGNKGISRALIASGSFGRSMSEYSGQGASPTQALLMSTFDAGLELITEEMSLDRIIKQAEVAPGSFLEWLKNAAISGGIEVSEEELSFIGSTFLQAFVMGDRSAYNQRIQEAVAAGSSYADAKAAADLELLKEGAMTAIQSFLSGGMMSGAAQAGAVLNANQTGRNLRDQGISQQQTQELMQQAQANPDSEAAQVAAQIEKKSAKSGKISALDQGRLYQAAAQDESFADIVQRQFEEGFRRQLGITDGGGVAMQTDVAAGEIAGSDWDMLDRLSQVTGRKVEVFSEEATATGLKNGAYKNGVIYINTHGNDPVVQTFSHEMTHSIEMAESYGKLRNLVFQRIQETGGDLKTIRTEKKKLYAEQGIKLSAEEVDKEIVAQYVADHLLTNEESIVNLTRQDRRLSQRILGWLDKLLARLGKQSAQEREFLRKARDLYAKALEQTKGKPVQMATPADQTQNQDTGKAMEETAGEDWDWDDYREALANDLAAGKISEEYYDEQMEFVDQQEALEGQQGTGGQFSYSGVKAKNADLQALDTAEELEQRGVAAETIRQQTGWFRGKDGKWRFEVDDSTAQVSGDISNYMKLKDLLKGAKILEEYPDLAEADVVFQSLEPGVYASYNPQFDTVNVSYALKGDPEGIRGAVLHEIQHAIQDREGFSKGSTVQAWEKKLKAGFDSRRAEEIRSARETEQQIAQIREIEPEFYRDMMELNAMTPDLPRGKVDWDTLEKIEDDPPEWQAYDARREELEETYGDIKVWDFNHLLYEQERNAKNLGRTATELYFDTAGEIEARDTAGRRNLTEEQRKKTPPVLGGEDAVFAEGNGSQFSFSPTEIQTIQNIGRKSVNTFSSSDINATEKFAQRYWKEMNVKSPFFRAWFGDWRSSDQTPVQVADQRGDTRGAQHNEDTGWDINVSGQVFNETKSHKAVGNKEARKYLPYIDDIVKKAVLLDSYGIGKPKSQNSLLMHSLYAVADVGNGPEVLKLYVEEMNTPIYDATTKRAYQLQNIEKAFGASVRVQGNPPSSLTNTSNAIKSVADLFAAVKNYDSDFNPNTESKVVNTDGTPKVMYHGTRAENGEFWEFDSSKAVRKGGLGLRALGKGNYFTAKQLDGTERYGSRVIPAYLSIKNPYVYNGGGSFFEQAASDMGLDFDNLNADTLQQEMRNRGYDGVIQYDSDGEVSLAVTFDSVQIKSATDNIGTFDGANPDIRYSFSPVAAGEQTNTQSAEQTEQDLSQAEVRLQLPKKALGILEKAERDLENKLGYDLYVPRVARRTFLRPIVQELSNAYLENGTIDQEKVDFLFDKAFAEGIIADSEFYDQYKDVKKKLKTTAVTLHERNRADIADYADFKKQARYDLKIADSGGLPVDSAYREMQEMAPELFPESITHPADQLQHMLEVSRSIRISEYNLQQYFGDSAKEFRDWSKGKFQTTVQTMAEELRNVKRYADEKAEKEAAKLEQPATMEEVKEAYAKLKDTRRAYERAQAKNLLTDEDNMAVGRLLRGEILLEHLDPKLNVSGIQAVYEAKREYEEQAKLIGKYRQYQREKLRWQADTYLETALQWKDKGAGILYSRETMRRNIQDIVKDKDLAKAINDEYFEPVHTAEAEATRFKTEFRNKVRDMDVSTKIVKGDLVSEAHAVQLYGEAMDNIEMIRKSRGRMKTRDGKTAQEWQAVIEELFDESPSLDRWKIERSVEQFRKIYDDLFARMNDVRILNGYEPVNYRNGYFPHFQPGDGENMLLQFGKMLGIDTQTAALPTTINGLTHTFRPGIQWFGNAQQRLGFNTAYDAVEGFDKYIEGVANVIYHTENIQKLRALESQIRYRTSSEGIQKQVDAVNDDNRLTEEEKRMKIEEIYKNGKFALSNFVNELSEYTNLLAGKKSRLDRGVEAALGRKFYTVVKNFENRVGANMIAGNLSSALTNFVPLTQAAAQLDRDLMLKGMWSTLQAVKEDDGLRSASSFLTNRRGSDVLVKMWTEKASEVLGKPMELIDNFVSESIVRAAYEQNLRQGMSEAEAMYEADIFASGVMGDRSKGSMPTLFESRNPIVKAFTQFQLEVNNQFSEVFKDLPRRHREKGLGVLAAVLFKYFLGAFLYNEAYEFLVGRRPAMDPIGLLNETAGDWLGYELPNLVDMGISALKGEEISLKTERVGFGEATKNLGSEVLGQLPFSSGLTLFGIETDGGRIPASSAIPDLTALWDAATREGWSPEKRWYEAQQELNKLAYVIPPFGGSQIAKAWKGIAAFLEGGSYSVDSEGNDILQHPIFREEDGFGTFMQAALLGKNSLQPAQEWVDGGFDSLSAKKTAIYQDLVAAGTGQREAYEFIRNMESVVKTGTQSAAQLRRKMLMESNLSTDAKAIVYYGMLASESDREVMDTMANTGADSGEVSRVLMEIQNAGTLTGVAGSCAERSAIANSALTDEEKMTIYREKISDSKDEEISQLMAVGLGFDDFLEIQNRYSQIGEEYSGAGDKAMAFSHWVNQQGYTERQENAIKESFRYFSMFPVAAQRYDDLVAAGLNEQVSYELASSLNDLEPVDGATTVNDLQRYRVIIDSGISEEQQMRALEMTIGEGLYERVNVVHSAGVTPEQYLKFRELLPQFDLNGSGSFSQNEIKAALDSMGDSGDDNPLLLLIGAVKSGEGLTNAQRAAIWQSYNKTWKPHRNPYDRDVGQRVYNLMNQEEPEEESSMLDFGDEVMRQLMENLK